LRGVLRNTIAVLLAWLVCAPVPARAHHSFAAEYDAHKPVTMKGTVVRVLWINPHSHIYLDVTDARGKVTTWNIEMAARGALTRHGWTAATVKPGDTITVEADLARSGNGAHARTVILADGTRKRI
jgi:hypothetical protein